MCLISCLSVPMEFMSASGITRVDMDCKGSPVADKGQQLALYVTL